MRFSLLFLVLCALVATSHPGCADGGLPATEWTKYRTRFVTDDGRVLDTGNKAVSHTEGQGWAMLFAEAHGDRAAFDKVWNWTRDNLQRHDNALFCWRWDPADKAPVTDSNNASDGDILIGWALIRAARRWNEPGYLEAAHGIVADIRSKLLYHWSNRLVLLPGSDGFQSEDGITVVNPSYYIYPAIKDFARIMPAPEWQRLRRDGLSLLSEARFGRWRLTPDWVDLAGTGSVAPATKFPARFGFDAIRVPLYLMWAGDATAERLASYLDFWNDFGGKPIPAWTDVKDNSVAPYAVPTGFEAIIQLARAFRHPKDAELPTIADNDDYYSASLTLLARVAQREMVR
jgi:endoglucanase